MAKVSPQLKFKAYEIPNPMFHYDIYVVVAKDFAYAAKKLDLISPPTDSEAFHAFSNEGKSHLYFHPNAKPSTVVHEVWHAVRRQLNWIGAELDNEVVAYMLGYYTRHVLDILKEHNKKK